MKPSDIAVVLAAIPGTYGARDGWITSDEVRHRLEKLGFSATPQWTSARLRALAIDRHDPRPLLEVRDTYFRIKEYRITEAGRKHVTEQFPGVILNTPWLPTWRS